MLREKVLSVYAECMRLALARLWRTRHSGADATIEARMPISSTSDASGLYVAIGLAFDPWCFGHSLLQLSASLHPAARSALVFLIASVIVYRRHRSMHMSDWLWRT
ncbi:hypothetical protein ACS5PK_01750 [Roseateles sp. DB2]|uniref:hypothetical protein n=1 Tax=Roseateles sp. DB2 TaxID=3453717 RepID=UPI003EECF314